MEVLTRETAPEKLEEIDLDNLPTPLSTQAAQALSRRIIQLQRRIKGMQGTATKDPESEFACKKAQLQKLLSRLKTEAKNTKFFSNELRRTVLVVDTMTCSEFALVFKDRGVQVQPMPSCKPTSVITVIKLTRDEITELFNPITTDPLQLKTCFWTRGGLPVTRTLKLGAMNFAGGNTFLKSVRIGPTRAHPLSMGNHEKWELIFIEVSFNRNTLKIVLKVECAVDLIPELERLMSFAVNRQIEGFEDDEEDDHEDEDE